MCEIRCPERVSSSCSTLVAPIVVNDREYRRGNQKWTILRNWQHRVQDDDKQNENTTQYAIKHRQRKYDIKRRHLLASFTRIIPEMMFIPGSK
jgi:hypothetical protein